MRLVQLLKDYLFQNKPEKETEIVAEGKEKPKRSWIYKAMALSGWTSYEAYLNLIHMRRLGIISSYQEIDGQQIKDYKAQKAEKLLEHEFFTLAGQEDLLTKDEFDRWFFVKAQKAAIADMKNHVLTYETLVKFLETELPDGFENADKDISTVIKTRANTLNKGDVFIMYSKKEVTTQLLERIKPSLVICGAKNAPMVAKSKVPYIIRSNLRGYAGELSSIWRTSMGTPTVGITGSVGKTTTTDMIGKVAGDSLNMFKIKGNQNTEKQVPGMVFRLRKNHEVFVQEAAGSFPGQLELSSHALTPNIFVITNIGTGHIGNYDGNRHLLMYEKLALDRHAAENAIGIINMDDELLSSVIYEHEVRRISTMNPQADFYSNGINEQDGKITFEVVEKSGQRTPMTLYMCGVHNVYNAMAAFAVGVELGIDRAKIAKSLLTFRTDGMRQNYVRYGGRHLYFDCYSTTQESIRSTLIAMRNFSTGENGRKILVIGDIIQPLGEKAESIHRDIGKMIAEIGSTDEVFLYGDFLKFAYEEMTQRGVTCRYTDDFDTVDRWVREETNENDVVCFKANHFSMLQWIIDNICGTNFHYYDELCEMCPLSTVDGVTCRLVEKYGGGIDSVKNEAAEIIIPENVDGFPVRIIGKGAFSKLNSLESVVLPDAAMCISEKCFDSCKSLKQVKFGKKLQFVDARSFNGCTGLEALDFTGTNLSTVEQEAFRGCSALKTVKFPDTLKFIGEAAFDANSKVTVVCNPGTYAENWAKENGFMTAAL